MGSNPTYSTETVAQIESVPLLWGWSEGSKEKSAQHYLLVLLLCLTILVLGSAGCGHLHVRRISERFDSFQDHHLSYQ